MDPRLQTMLDGIRPYVKMPMFSVGHAVMIDRETPGVITKANQSVWDWPDRNDPQHDWRVSPWLYEVAIVDREPAIGRAYNIDGIVKITVGEHRLSAHD
jgi:hypothetical protein